MVWDTIRETAIIHGPSKHGRPARPPDGNEEGNIAACKARGHSDAFHWAGEVPNGTAMPVSYMGVY